MYLSLLALLLCVTPTLLSARASARGHHSYHSVRSSGYAAGPGDTSRAHDYARHIGSANDRSLSTGWTHGHGARTEHTRDYYRHTRSGALVHVHSYYHRPRSR